MKHCPRTKNADETRMMDLFAGDNTRRAYPFSTTGAVEKGIVNSQEQPGCA